mmetsp:Transcript_6386/g.9276  ORF Transcript_6386/g.9276 Transcript_6386/m.9276 type:complete len:267 (-) Transcript_6386:162-962(-)|eukprot:CAMPEP_0184857246 /NCGR_PEP_ID=MMETSP0580-20130426/2408_1 /TAXON_ID=1118495 /ORGANISM="Dactyliosolen fragilissimus" /LENGTH=266 /DNA_ID=CAMNT_0027352729 /DNA_START=26 /DNA_END=826 /DNA_ORIENTATION=-
MMNSRPLLFLARRAATSTNRLICPTTNSTVSHCAKNQKEHLRLFSGLPESVKRVGEASCFPNEKPGLDYDFNWALNYDGVTPTKKSAYRFTKPLDVKISGLKPVKAPLKVNAAASRALMPEAGSDELSFETFDEVNKRTKELLSSADNLYCPEGHAPGTRTSVRIISNSPVLAPKLLAYLERAPKRDPTAHPITAYVLEGTNEDFNGYAIEEIVDSTTGEEKSVAAVVIVGKNPSIENVVAGIELSVAGLMEDEAARAEAASKEEA